MKTHGKVMAKNEFYFDTWKTQCLKSLDLSRKGSIDDRIAILVEQINKSDHYFTTSSCSGRCVVFCQNETAKKGCQWILVTHDKIESEKLEEALDATKGNLVIKFEPFILHVQCRTIQHAQTMLQIAVASGYRNSGLTIGKKGKIIAAVRSPQTLEVPVSTDNKLLVDYKFIQYLTVQINEKFDINWEKIQRFHENLLKELEPIEDSPNNLE